MTGPAIPDRPASWTEALDRLEAHADRAEHLLRGESAEPAPAPWQPPAELGPLPNELVPRARQLLARQQRLMAAIPAVLSDKRQQQRIADRVGDATTAAVTPIYLDVTA
ncbi:hypothetical protein ACIRN4_12955 [Pimelobacter simplex]|uniref:Uncharacterized protein n=1 Tax=Nocardioides simplex TaxID=2045 RepID=A0A7J5DR80_NOCSI|nr:hypothetical protein [Pimelobacter simplex]KAB2807255.1 hypothetical protein F9L07_27645 [Pimelobacter simplex]